MFGKRMTEWASGEYSGIHTKKKKPRYRNDNGAFLFNDEVRSGSGFMCCVDQHGSLLIEIRCIPETSRGAY